jgi:glycerol-3-phosphate dehydrogenase (NAD(P)+)
VTRVAVVGTTAWGTTLAVLLARGGAGVTLYARTPDEASALNQDRRNRRHRSELSFPESLAASADLAAVAEAETVVLVVPSAALRSNLDRIYPAIAPEATVLSATKGIEPESGLRVSEIIAAYGIAPRRLLALSGPNFAVEIAAGLPAATVVAGLDHERAVAVQAMLNGPLFRVYTSDDIIGVEIGGALKNVVAIACGISDGLGYGENARAGLITRALAEITRLGVAAGARPLTFLGLAGLGDLILTCASDLSRNRRLGLALASGLSLDEALAGSAGGVVEGAVTARAVPALARRYGVEMPICQALYEVLYQAKAPARAVQDLMARAARPEVDGSLMV